MLSNFAPGAAHLSRWNRAQRPLGLTQGRYTPVIDCGIDGFVHVQDVIGIHIINLVLAVAEYFRYKRFSRHGFAYQPRLITLLAIKTPIMQLVMSVIAASAEAITGAESRPVFLLRLPGLHYLIRFLASRPLLHR